jgi:hypothetical protein
MVDAKQYLVSSVRTQFTLLTVFWWIGFPLAAIGGFVPEFDIASLMPLGVVTVFWCILLYRHWMVLQGFSHRTTPGRAVGFGFIPIFNFYWWFVAYAGLATDTNRYLEHAGITHCRMSRPLAIADCVISILWTTAGLYPPIGGIIAVPAMIVGYILVVQQRNCLLAILEYQYANEAQNQRMSA